MRFPSLFISGFTYTGPLGKSPIIAVQTILKNKLVLFEWEGKGATNEGHGISDLEELSSFEQFELSYAGPKNDSGYIGALESLKPFCSDKQHISRHNPVGEASVLFSKSCEQSLLKLHSIGRSDNILSSMEIALDGFDKRQIDCVFGNADGNADSDDLELKAVKLMGLPVVTSVKANIGLDDFGVISLVLALQSLSLQIFPFTRNCLLKDKSIITDRSWIGGEAFRHILFNHKCSRSKQYFSLRIEYLKSSERGELGRKLIKERHI